MFVCLHVCLCGYVCVCKYVSLRACAYVFEPVFVFMLCVFVCLEIFLMIVCVCLYGCLSVFLCKCV